MSIKNKNLQPYF